MHPALLVWLAIQTDRNEHRDQKTFVASGVVVREFLSVAEHLIDIGGFGFHPVLEFDDEDGAVLENDQIWTATAAARDLEFEDKREAGRIWKARAQFISQRAKRSVPRQDLRCSCLLGEGRQLAEDLVLRRIEKRLHVTEPAVPKFGHHRNVSFARLSTCSASVASMRQAVSWWRVASASSVYVSRST